MDDAWHAKVRGELDADWAATLARIRRKVAVDLNVMSIEETGLTLGQLFVLMALTLPALPSHPPMR